jgi:hypothetical protein
MKGFRQGIQHLVDFKDVSRKIGEKEVKQEYRSSGVQEFRSTGVQGVQEFRSSGVRSQEFRSIPTG